MNRPWFPFHSRDWSSDVEVHSCSRAARATWIEMLCLMHESGMYGVLCDRAGKPVAVSVIASRAACTIDEAAEDIAELETHQVFSRTPEGLIYSRRMVRDEAEREKDNIRQQRHRAASSFTAFSTTSHVTELSRQSHAVESESESESESEERQQQQYVPGVECAKTEQPDAAAAASPPSQKQKPPNAAAKPKPTQAHPGSPPLEIRPPGTGKRGEGGLIPIGACIRIPEPTPEPNLEPEHEPIRAEIVACYGWTTPRFVRELVDVSRKIKPNLTAAQIVEAMRVTRTAEMQQAVLWRTRLPEYFARDGLALRMGPSRSDIRTAEGVAAMRRIAR